MSSFNEWGETIYSQVFPNVCLLTDDDYEDLTGRLTQGGSDSSASTQGNDEHLPEHVPFSFRVDSTERVYLRMASEERVLRRVSDLPGVDCVLKPCDSLSLHNPQFRLYRTFTRFLMQNRILFTGTFRCASRLTQASHGFHNGRIFADRPVPVHAEELNQDFPLRQVTSVHLGRHFGKRICHASPAGNRRVADYATEKVIYLGLSDTDSDSGRDTGSDSDRDIVYTRDPIPEEILRDEDFHLCATLLTCGRKNFYPGHTCRHSLRCISENILVTLCKKDNRDMIKDYIVASPWGCHDEKEFLRLDYESGEWEVFGYCIEIRLPKDLFRQARRLVRMGLDAVHNLSSNDKSLLRHAGMACPRLFKSIPGTCFATLSDCQVCEISGFTPTLHDLRGRLTVVRNGQSITTVKGVTLRMEDGVYHCTTGRGYQSLAGFDVSLLVVGNVWQKNQLEAGLKEAMKEMLKSSLVVPSKRLSPTRRPSDRRTVEFVTRITGHDVLALVNSTLGESDTNVFVADELVRRAVRLGAQKWEQCKGNAQVHRNPITWPFRGQ